MPKKSLCCEYIKPKYFKCQYHKCKKVINRHIKKICDNQNQLPDLKCKCNYCNYVFDPAPWYIYHCCYREIFYCKDCEIHAYVGD